MTANEQDDERAARLERVTLLALDHDVLERFITAHRDATRESLVASGHVLPSAPPKGDAVLLSDDRGEQGDELLEYAKDVLFALLLGEASTHTFLDRVRPERLALTLPHFKADALAFVRDGEDAPAEEGDVVVALPYRETAEGIVGTGVRIALTLVNELELNEPTLRLRAAGA